MSVIPEDIVVLSLYLIKTTAIIKEELKLPYYTHKQVRFAWYFCGIFVQLLKWFVVNL